MALALEVLCALIFWIFPGLPGLLVGPVVGGLGIGMLTGGVELEIRLLTVHRERLVNSRTRLINELRWHLHDLWPDWEIRERGLTHPALQQQVVRRLELHCR